MTDLANVTIAIPTDDVIEKSPLTKLPRKILTQMKSPRKNSILLGNHHQKMSQKKWKKMIILSAMKTNQ